MFKPLSMQHVSLWVLNSDAPQASLLLWKAEYSQACGGLSKVPPPGSSTG